MKTETQRPTGTVVSEDPQEINWRNQVNEWVRGNISYSELLAHYPTHLLSIPERVIRFVRTKASQITGKGKVVE